MTKLEEIEAMLPTELFAGSKDWVAGDVVERVDWLLSMYESCKQERDMYLAQLEMLSNI